MKSGISLKTATANLLDPSKAAENRERTSDSETEAETSCSKSSTGEIQHATSDVDTDTPESQDNGFWANTHCVITEEPVIISMETESKEESNGDDASCSSQDAPTGDVSAIKFKAPPPKLFSGTGVRRSPTETEVPYACESADGLLWESSSHHQPSEASHREDLSDDGLLKHLERYIVLIKDIIGNIDDMPENYL